MKKLYNHISEWERKVIERLVQAGKSNKAIAEVLGRSKSTIGRELERNCWRLGCRGYRSEVAEGIAKKRGITRKNFNLHLKETEWRFNHRNENIYKFLLNNLRHFPL